MQVLKNQGGTILTAEMRVKKKIQGGSVLTVECWYLKQKIFQGGSILIAERCC